jgi:phosphoserine phosphatase
MRRLYLLRHGESEWNLSGQVQGTKDSELTEKGIEQAKLAANRLKLENIDKIYSSPLKRAKHTAEVVAESIGIESIVDIGLKEMCFGHWEGVLLKEIQKDNADEFMMWKKSPHKFKVKDSESLKEVQERMLNVIKKIKETEDAENVLLVSHGTAIKAMVLGLLGIDLSKYGNFSVSNTGITLIEFGDYNTVMRYFNDKAHLLK